MAVTLTADDLRQPTGDLDATYFPDGNLDQLLPGWLSDAVVKIEGGAIEEANHNTGAAAWVYYRAYTYLARRLGSMPSSTSLMQQSATINQNRVDYWEDRAAVELARFEALIVAPTESPAQLSGAMRTVVSW